MARFGIEEEFILLDDTGLVPVGLTGASRERIARPIEGGQISTEYLTSQLECSTHPLHTAAEAVQHLSALRAVIGEHARAQGAVAAPTGSPFATTGSAVISPSPHYDDVSARLAHLSRGHEVNGLHVHVEVEDDEERVRGLNRVRPWLPALLALTGNSPYANGLDAGFASWRSILIRRLPNGWCPPRFHDLEDYRRHVQQFIDLGTIGEATSIGWDVRLSERYPTVEVRVFDAQLAPEDAVLAAVLSRALVRADDEGTLVDHVDGIDAALWSAARSGMQARIIDPTTGDVSDADTVVATMLDRCRSALQQFGDAEHAADGIARLRADGIGAERQRRAYRRDGVPGLAALLAEGTRPDLP